METYHIEILEPEAKKLLDDMAEMDLISVQHIDVEGSNGKHIAPGVRDAIMALAGSWDDMFEGDFQEYLSETNSALLHFS